jgi:Fe-S-cluster containining protein
MFDFCGSCPAHAHCCHRIRTLGAKTLGEMESPFLLQREADAISTAKGIAKEKFINAELKPDGVESLSIKPNNGKCFFYEDGTCSVYQNRPLDCRLFPFDMIQDASGNLYWIVYEELCPAKFDFRRYFHSAKRLVKQSNYSLDELRAFAEHGAEVMLRHTYKIIELVAVAESVEP